jgi:hypothetical protein
MVMPQPFKGGTVMLGNAGHYPLEERPELLRLAMRVIVAWSTLEVFIAGALATMLGTKAAPAVAIYSMLQSTKTQQDALIAAAETELSNAHLELLEALLMIFGSLAKQRNKIVHWVWGISPDHPDGVLLAEPDVMIQSNLNLEKHLRALTEWSRDPDRRQREPPGLDRLQIEKIWVYNASDFTELAQAIDRLSGHFLSVRHVLWRTAESAQRFETLCNKPDVAEALHCLRQCRKKSQEELPLLPGSRQESHLTIPW